MQENTKKKSGVERFISGVEKVGNKLPHPIFLFAYLTVLVLIIAHLLDGATFTVPGKSEQLTVTTLLNADGFRYMLTNFIRNFSDFPATGLVIPIVIAVSIGEQAGLYEAAMIKLVQKVPRKLATAVFFFAGICGNIASDASVVLMPTIGAALYQGFGRNPLIGVVAGYAAYLGGLSANVLICGTDVTLSGITAPAAEILPATASCAVHPAINYYFMAVSAFVLTLVGTYVTENIVAPMLDKQSGITPIDQTSTKGLELTDNQQKGLKYAGIALLVCIFVLLLLSLPSGALLRDPETNQLFPKSPLMSGLVTIIVILFMVVGTAYGVGAKTIKSSYDLGEFMEKGTATIAVFLAMVLFCAQFTDYLNKTNLATWIAVKSAESLASLGFTGLPLVIAIVIFTVIVNFFQMSAIAKWAMLAPILVPMMGILGFTPAFTQCIYRIGDAAMNPMSPLTPYLPILVTFIQMYKKDAGLGTAIAYEIPYSVAFLLSWVALIAIWYIFKLPLGPGAGMFL